MTLRSLAHASMLTRRSLIGRLRDWKDAPSWEEFFRLYRRLVYGLARRSGLTHPEAEDIVQDVFRHVADKIGDFEARPNRGAFRRWLMNQTRWRITDRFRERVRSKSCNEPEGTLEYPGAALAIDQIAGPDGQELEAAWETEWQRHVLDAALERLGRRVPARQFQAFDLYSRQGWEARRVAEELGITTPAVYMYNHRITKQLKAEVKRLQRRAG